MYKNAENKRKNGYLQLIKKIDIKHAFMYNNEIVKYHYSMTD